MSLRTMYRRKRAAGLTKPQRRISYDSSFFEEWTPELAWVLGLIWTDGYLSKRGHSVEICSKDREMLETVEDLVGMDDGIRPTNGGRAWRIFFRGKGVVDRLRSLGLHTPKSFTITWPTDLPDGLAGHFLRGVIDGNGSVCLNRYRTNQKAPDLRVHLVGASPAFLEGVCSYLDRMGVRHTATWPRANLWKINVTQQSAAHKLHGILYPHPDVPCLGRKREPYDLWLNTPRGLAGHPGCHRMIEFRGETKHLSAWAREVGLRAGTISLRLKSGWSVEDALIEPLRERSKS